MKGDRGNKAGILLKKDLNFQSKQTSAFSDTFSQLKFQFKEHNTKIDSPIGLNL